MEDDVGTPELLGGPSLKRRRLRGGLCRKGLVPPLRQDAEELQAGPVGLSNMCGWADHVLKELRTMSEAPVQHGCYELFMLFLFGAS